MLKVYSTSSAFPCASAGRYLRAWSTSITAASMKGRPLITLQLRTIPSTVTTQRTETVVLAVFRPEDLRRADRGEIEATVDVSIFLGSTTRVYAHVGEVRVAADLPSRDAAGLQQGAVLRLAL